MTENRIVNINVKIDEKKNGDKCLHQVNGKQAESHTKQSLEQLAR